MGRIRGAVVSGDRSWGKAELLSRHATAENEVELLGEAIGSTLRTARKRLEGVDPERDEKARARVSTTMPVSETEVAMVIATRRMVGHLVGREVGDEAFVEALLAEAETSLQHLRHEDRGPRSIHRVDFAALEAALEAMKPCRPRRARPGQAAWVPHRRFEPVPRGAVPGTIEGIDAEIVRLARALARRNLELGRQLHDFAATRRWARLGCPSPSAYARERLGSSLSSASIGSRSPGPPNGTRLSSEPGGGLDRHEAGLLVAQALGRSASEALAWARVGRARRRTIKLLRDEVWVVVEAAAFSPGVSRMPPETRTWRRPVNSRRRS